MDDYFIGIDFGGSKVAAGIVDLKGKVLKKRKINVHPSKEKNKVLDQISNLLQSLVKEAGINFSIIKGVGFGVPGQVDIYRGFLHYAPNLNWRDVPIKDLLSSRLPDVPVFIDNDVRAATLAEYHFLQEKIDNMVCIFVGTGIGGGIIINGEIYRGSHGIAGEIGHTIIDINGPQCSCGSFGCFESVASGTAIIRQAKHAIKKDLGRKILELAKFDEDKILASTVAKAARMNDQTAQKIIEETGKNLAKGIASIINFINPALVLLGGGVIENIPELIDICRENFEDHLLPPVRGKVKLLQVQLKDDSGIIGGAWIAKLGLKRG